ncbi:MAG: hypothetical protein EOS73_22460 [Mesorhizobium sp.]|uniref:hypothetical protein n=1 Tax=Mesorhizobium sp. M7A.F.Ca.ET.027.02.1.1 TaxID=2496655 RepID=UPI000FD242D1|nr:hypothetical protein [Mesorhizobium sp. M7A.F.Ca.ET.027.02.1.1]RVD17340.1 hypothetical protein EN749_09015 [Mesorhizobium sp. M7A.F.Ca.ET.027.02.1.1]RWD02840.1 MAG: hypothetical protein EOS73_22460 [Mesorhizobium sp.]
MTDKKPKPQIDKFREASREFKIDQTETTFEAVVDKVAHAPKLTAEQIKKLVQQQREAARRLDGKKSKV